MRHSSDLIKNIKKMRMANFTLGEIVAKTGLPKTSVYYHMRTLSKSNFLVSKILDARRKAQKKQAEKRRGKSIKPYKFVRNQKWTADFVRLVAHFLFDGEIRRLSCNYNNRNVSLINRVISLMDSIFAIDDYRIYKKPDGVIRISYNNVEFAGFIKEKSVELLSRISRADSECKRSFLQAFFDDEGCAYFRPTKNVRCVRGFQHKPEILHLIERLLDSFGIYSKIDRRFNEIIISGRKNLEKFAQHINFSLGVRINGKRSNSTWKKDLEKSKILEMAINSYQT